MKPFLSLLLLLLSGSYVAAKCTNKIITIENFARGGNYNVIIIIGSDSNSVIQKAHEFKAYLPDPFLEMYYIKPEAVEFLSVYISNRCIPVNNRTPHTESGCSINIISNCKKENCYIMGRGASKPYFIGLKKWLEESSYKANYLEIIERIKPWTH